MSTYLLIKIAKGTDADFGPVIWGTGIMTFFINQNGVVYEKDLGKTTEETAKAIAEFNPDKTWKAVEP